MRTGRESYGLVAGPELDVEPGDQGVNEVAAAHIKGEGGLEGEFFGGDGVEVKSDDSGRIGDYGFHFNSVNQWLSERCSFQRRVVEPVNIVPNYGT